MEDKSDLLDSAASAAAQSAVKQSENIAQTLGRWCASLVSNSEFGLRWRLDNLSRISARFDRLCQARGISPTQRDAIASKFGILWLEGASMEEADSLQALWAELLASEAVDGQVPLAAISALKMMRPRDAAVFQRACNLALEHKGVFFIPVSLSSVRQTGVFVNRLEDYGLNTRDLVLLESLGLLNASTVHAVELGFGEPVRYQGRTFRIEAEDAERGDHGRSEVTGLLVGAHVFTDAGTTLLQLADRTPAMSLNDPAAQSRYFEGYVETVLLQCGLVLQEA